MKLIDKILQELDESYILEHIIKKHDETRIKYLLIQNTVSDDTEFDDIIADYYKYHYAQCVSEADALTHIQATYRAKEIIEREYKNKGQDLQQAYVNGKDVRYGGMRVILDIILEQFKRAAIKRHIHDVRKRYIEPLSPKEQKSILKKIKLITGFNLSDNDH